MNQDETIKLLQDLCQGNPGALDVCTRLHKGGHEKTLLWLKDKGIKGPAIWLFYKDHGDQTIETFVKNSEGGAEGILSSLRETGYLEPVEHNSANKDDD